MKVIRWVLGRIILLLNAIFSPSGMKRSEQEQAKVNQDTEGLKLYQFNACPFCVKVRRSMKRLSLPIEARDAQNDKKWEQELIEQGGKRKVPCLRIEEKGEVTWMYESNDIITYLEKRFA